MGGIFSNRVLIVSLISWLVAQVLKVVFIFVTKKKLDFRMLVGSGGMPSSHSAFVTSLSVSVGKLIGFNSPEFAMCTVFAFIVMYDAAGVRRAAGKQARILNIMMKEMQDTGKLKEKRLKELIGHTPVEVLAGAAVGIIVSLLL